MKFYITNSKKAAPFMRKWKRYKAFFTYSLTEDVILMVEENLERAYVDQTGVLHVPMEHFGYYVEVIDNLMQKIASREVGSRDVYKYLTERLS